MIIAEAGVNHNGIYKNAKRLVDFAYKAKVDAVKFQIYDTDELVSRSLSKADYQKISNKDETMYQMLKKYELNFDNFKNLKIQCNLYNLKFIASVFGFESLKMINKLKINYIKIPSGEITNLPLIEKIGKMKKKIIISTGLSSINEIRKARKLLKQKSITILHCNTAYPTPFNDANLLMIKKLNDIFPNDKIGYSDHTVGIEASLASVVLGAKVVEKHFTLNKQDIGPDHLLSSDFNELTHLVNSIRNIEKSLSIKKNSKTKSEANNLKFVRKSIVAKIDIKKGDVFSLKNIDFRRPAIGKNPDYYFKIRNKISKKNYKKGEII